MVNLIGFVLIIACWVIGGQKSGRIRDVPVPIIIGLCLAISFKIWWLFFALVATYQMIRLGYGNYSPEDDPEPSFLASITHDRGGWWIRAIWGALVASVGGLPLILGHFIGVWVYLGYIILVTVVCYLVSKLRLPVLITDILVAASVGSIVFAK